MPDAVGDLRVCVDLRARRVLTSVSVDAPREGRAKSRINWLVRQLREAPADLQLEAAFPNARQTTSSLLEAVRDDPEGLFYPPDSKREPRAFVITQGRPMGQKRGKAEGSFVRDTSAQTFDFYRDIVQGLKRWQARPPKLRGAADLGGEDTGERSEGTLSDQGSHDPPPVAEARALAVHSVPSERDINPE